MRVLIAASALFALVLTHSLSAKTEELTPFNPNAASIPVHVCEYDPSPNGLKVVIPDVIGIQRLDPKKRTCVAVGTVIPQNKKGVGISEVFVGSYVQDFVDKDKPLRSGVRVFWLTPEGTKKYMGATTPQGDPEDPDSFAYNWANDQMGWYWQDHGTGKQWRAPALHGPKNVDMFHSSGLEVSLQPTLLGTSDEIKDRDVRLFKFRTKKPDGSVADLYITVVMNVRDDSDDIANFIALWTMGSLEDKGFEGPKTDFDLSQVSMR